MLLLLILFASTAAFVSACTSRAPATVAVAPQEAFTVSFASGSRDVTGRFMGGTEMRVLAAHGGKLYAGNGYWEDRPGPEGLQGAQVLMLDSPAARWAATAGCRRPLRPRRAFNVSHPVSAEPAGE